LPEPIVAMEGQDGDVAGRGVDAHGQPAPGPHQAFHQPRLPRTESAQDADPDRRLGVPAHLFELDHEVGDASTLALIILSIAERSKPSGQVQTPLTDLCKLHGEPPQHAWLHPRVCLESPFIRSWSRNIYAWTTNIAVPWTQTTSLIPRTLSLRHESVVGSAGRAARARGPGGVGPWVPPPVSGLVGAPTGAH